MARDIFVNFAPDVHTFCAELLQHTLFVLEVHRFLDLLRADHELHDVTSVRVVDHFFAHLFGQIRDCERD